MGSKGIALGTVDTTLDSSSWFVGRPDIGNGCAETRGYHNSTQEIHCIPIKHRGNPLFWAQHLWSTRSPINRLCFHERLALIYLRIALRILPTSETLVRFLCTCGRQLSFLWEVGSSLAAVGDFLYFHKKLYWCIENCFYLVFHNFWTNTLSMQETVYTAE